MSLFLAGIESGAESLFYKLDNVVFREDGEASTQQMLGYFSWTYPPGDFENGTGEFLYLEIPGTAHDHTDLASTFDLGSIEITLEGSVHDDGVDLTLFLSPQLSPGEDAVVNSERSRFDIGGNGFYAGTIISGRVVPFEFQVGIARNTTTSASVWWTPDYPGAVLQQSISLAAPIWTNSASGNPLIVSTSSPMMVYRLVAP